MPFANLKLKVDLAPVAVTAITGMFFSLAKLATISVVDEGARQIMAVTPLCINSNTETYHISYIWSVSTCYDDFRYSLT